MKTKTHLSSFSPAQPSSAPPRPSTFSTSTPPANDILRVLANVCIRHLTILQSLRWNYDPGQSKLEIRCENLAHSQQEMVPWANLVNEPGRWLCIMQGPEPQMDAYEWAKPVTNVETVRPPAVVTLATHLTSQTLLSSSRRQSWTSRMDPGRLGLDTLLAKTIDS